MKKLFRLIILCVMLFAGYKYMEYRGIPVNKVAGDVTTWFNCQIDEMQRQNQKTEKENSSGHNSLSNNFSEEKRTNNTNRSYNQAVIDDNEAVSSIVISCSNTSGSSIDSNIDNTAPSANLKDEEKLAWLLNVTREYSPNSWYLLQQYDYLPQNLSTKGEDNNTLSSSKTTNTYHYIEYGSLENMLSSLSTNVHEISHAYFRLNTFKYANENNLKLNWDNAEVYIYISPKTQYYISAPHKWLFPSNTLISTIPENLRTYRFDTYIDGNTSTQSDGIVGLLNEFNAYYLGAKFTYDMLDVYTKYNNTPMEGFSSWIQNMMSETGAFYEFDYFILEYLHYMKANKPEAYSQLIKVRNFVEAYKTVRSAYTSLLDEYFNTIEIEMKKLNADKDYKLWKEDNKLWFQMEGSNSSKGVKIYSDDVDKLKPVLNSAIYNDIKKDMDSL